MSQIRQKIHPPDPAPVGGPDQVPGEAGQHAGHRRSPVPGILLAAGQEQLALPSQPQDFVADSKQAFHHATHRAPPGPLSAA
ncbi:MAG: hypothetical protein ABSG52_09980 [Terriglobales bacterium]